MTEEQLDVLTAIRAMAGTPMSNENLGRYVRTLLGPSSTAVHVSSRDVVPIKVRFSDGSSTNISVPKALLQTVAGSLGSENAARSRARELAKMAPPTNNRSGWVQDQLALLVGAQAGDPA